MQEMQVWSLTWEDPLKENMATHSSILALPGKSHGQKNLEGYSPGVTKNQTHLSTPHHSIFHYINICIVCYITFCLSSYVSVSIGTVSTFWLLSVMLWTSIWALALNVFGSIPRRGIAGSYGSSVFKFLKSCHTLSHSGCTILHPTIMHKSSNFSTFSLTPNISLCCFLSFVTPELPTYSGILHCYKSWEVTRSGEGTHRSPAVSLPPQLSSWYFFPQKRAVSPFSLPAEWASHVRW